MIRAMQLGAFDRVLDRVKPGDRLKTPDEKAGQPFTVETVDLEGVSIKTAKGGRIRIGLFTFETAAKFLADRGVAGDRWLEVKDEDFQMLLNMENDRVRASSYVIAILGAAGVLDVDGGRPNKVRLAAGGEREAR
jgi:hypothetical protein